MSPDDITTCGVVVCRGVWAHFRRLHLLLIIFVHQVVLDLLLHHSHLLAFRYLLSAGEEFGADLLGAVKWNALSILIKG